MTEKITAKHLERKAMLYIRQSSMHQVRHREEGKQCQTTKEEVPDTSLFRIIEGCKGGPQIDAAG